MRTTIIKKWGRFLFSYPLALVALSLIVSTVSESHARDTKLFTKGWQFFLGDVPEGQDPHLDDSRWRTLDLPHDWSIEGEFNKDNPDPPGGGALSGGSAGIVSLSPSPNRTKANLLSLISTGSIEIAKSGSTVTLLASVPMATHHFGTS